MVDRRPLAVDKPAGQLALAMGSIPFEGSRLARIEDQHKISC